MVLPDPMLLSESKVTPLDKPGWIYEVKYDGYRIVAGVVDGVVQLRSRGGADYTRAFPEIVEALASLPGGPHIFDGEAVVLDENGRSDFNRFQDRARRRTRRPGDDPVVFAAFDLLAHDGHAVIGAPVEERKALLRGLLPQALDAVHYVEHFDAEHGRSLYRQAVTLGLEGLVAKRLGSLYRPGERSPEWVKAKVPGAVPPERFRF
jgi:bifunctional non-homologous end joining protein LigD